MWQAPRPAPGCAPPPACQHPADAGERALGGGRAPPGDSRSEPHDRGASPMCRWMAWSGQPVIVEELLFKTQHGLVDQSLHSRMGAETTNGDGFGLGWYGAGEGPGVYHSVSPAWGDANLRELAAHIESPLFLAHVRATTGTAIQQTNCHPFRHGKWLFVHNGVIAELPRDPARADARRRARAVPGDPGLDRLRGALPPRAHLRARGGSDRRARAHDRARRGDRARGTASRARCRRASASATASALWAFRYATQGEPRSLFVSSEADAIRTPASGRTRASSACTTTTASSSPSRCPTCRACGTRSRASTVADRAAGAG